MKSKTKIKVLLLAVLLITVFTVGCNKGPEITESKDKVDVSDNSFPLTLNDQIGREVTIEKLPERIVSLAPSNTEILFALGLGDKVVGVTDYCDYPEEVKTIDKVGGYSEPNIEKIISLKPDLILATEIHQKPVEELEKLGVTSVVVEPENFDEVFASIEIIGKATGRHNEAEALVNDLKARVKKMEDMVANIPEDERPKVLYELWHSPITTAGPGTFVDDIIQRAGGDNIAKDANKEYPQYSQEMIVAKNPDIIIFSHHGTTGATVEDILQRPGWNSINAVKNKKVYYVDENLVQRTTPRLVDGLEEFLKIIHPELFEN